MTYRVACVNFDHFHMGDHLSAINDHPDAEIVGMSDENRETSTMDIEAASKAFGVSDDRVYRDYGQCIEDTDPDIVILCPAPANHADWVERVAEYDANVILEKPFSTSVEPADRMIQAMAQTNRNFAINWPVAWYPTHRTTKRLLEEGKIGDILQLYYYDGNKGPQGFSQVPVEAESGEMHFDRDPVDSQFRYLENMGDYPEELGWWYDRESGGGSLIDYLGYGVTLGTWFRNGELPIEVSAQTHSPDELDVDTQSITIARYERGLSKYETCWGTFTDPWIEQPQPKCGFVIKGTEGTISSYDYGGTVRLQTDEHPDGREIPVDDVEPPYQNCLQYMIDTLEHDQSIEYGPLSPDLCREAQRIIDSARRSAEAGERVPVKQT